MERVKWSEAVIPIFVALVGLLPLACGPSSRSGSGDEEAADVEGAHMELIRELYEVWNTKAVERVEEHFTEDAVYEDVAGGLVSRGWEEIKAMIAEVQRWSPDFHVEMTSVFVAGDRAVTEWRMTGTHQGDLEGLPATGKGFSLRGVSLLQFEEGKVKRVTDYYDMSTFLRQLGATIQSP